MAATVEIQECNGATPLWNSITAAHFCAADVYAPGSSFPIPIPNSGFRYSFWKTFALLMTGIGTKINNIRIYCDGAIGWAVGSGGGLFVGVANSGDSGIAEENYDQATGTEGLTGDYMGGSSGHPVYKGAGYTVENIENYAVLTPLLVDNTDYIEDGRSKAVVLQAKIDTLANGAEQGLQTPDTLYFRYDEI